MSIADNVAFYAPEATGDDYFGCYILLSVMILFKNCRMEQTLLLLKQMQTRNHFGIILIQI